MVELAFLFGVIGGFLIGLSAALGSESPSFAASCWVVAMGFWLVGAGLGLMSFVV